jgi:hypothetical protein
MWCLGSKTALLLRPSIGQGAPTAKTPAAEYELNVDDAIIEDIGV